MTRRAEVAGIINPTVDEQQLEREAQDMGGRFERAAQLTPSIDTRKIQRQLERAIPGGGILGTAVDAIRGTGGGGGGGGGGQQSGGVVPGGESTIQTAMLDKLDDIHEEIEKIAVSGGFGGSDGGDGGGGLLSSIGAGAVGRKAAGVLAGAGGGSGAVSAIAGSTTATVTGAAAAGGALGLGGVAGLDRIGALGAIRNSGQEVGSMVGDQSLRRGLKTANTATFGGLGTTVQAGGTIVDIARGNGLNGPMSQQADRRFRGPGELASDAASELAEPKWLSTLTDPQISEPSWLSNLMNSSFSEPAWVSKLNDPIQVERPEWLEDLESSLNLDINFPAPKIDLATGSVQKEVEDAFDDFKTDVVGEVVDTVEDKLTPNSPL